MTKIALKMISGKVGTKMCLCSDVNPPISREQICYSTADVLNNISVNIISSKMEYFCINVNNSWDIDLWVRLMIRSQALI